MEAKEGKCLFGCVRALCSGGGREQDWNERIEKIQPDVEASSDQLVFFSFSGLGMASSELLRHRKSIAAAAEAGRRDFLLCGTRW